MSKPACEPGPLQEKCLGRYLMTTAKACSTGAEASASGELYSAADSAFRIESPPTCMIRSIRCRKAGSPAGCSSRTQVDSTEQPGVCKVACTSTAAGHTQNLEALRPSASLHGVLLSVQASDDLPHHTCSIGRACSALVAACHMLPEARPFATVSRVCASRRSLSTSTPCCLSHCAPDLQQDDSPILRDHEFGFLLNRWPCCQRDEQEGHGFVFLTKVEGRVQVWDAQEKYRSFATSWRLQTSLFDLWSKRRRQKPKNFSQAFPQACSLHISL